MIETILGGAIGGALRLAPEVLKWLDRKNEREHEHRMVQLQMEAEAKRAQMSRDAAWDVGALNALIEGVKAQAAPSGISGVDALSKAVRPTITFWYFGLYAAARTAAFTVAVLSGVPALEVLANVWTPADSAMLSGIINFWFLGRVFDKVNR